SLSPARNPGSGRAAGVRWGAVAVAVASLTGACAAGDGAGAPDPTHRQRSTTTSTPPAPVHGEDGLGDPYLPHLGGTGLDVGHYDLALEVTADGTRLEGTATIEATATAPLASFALDLAGLEVERATVDGRPAEVD